jgi:hypothetical protein
MCTIISIDRKVYEEVGSEIFSAHLASDAASNPHGFGLLMLGELEEDTVLIHSMNVDVIDSVIRSTKDWKRLWIHTRFATGTTVNLHGCHPFSSTGSGRKYNGVLASSAEHFLVMHNGIISGGDANNFFVDSMYIPEMIRMRGLAETLTYLKTVNYANVFIVNPVDGRWAVSRTASGTLFMDGKGNFSSNPLGPIKIPVPLKYTEQLRHEIKKPAVSQWPNYYRGSSYDYSDRDHWNTDYRSHRKENKKRNKKASTYPNSSAATGISGNRYFQSVWGDQGDYADDDWEDSVFTKEDKKAEVHTTAKSAYSTWCEYYKDKEDALIRDLKNDVFSSAEDFYDLAFDMEWCSERVPNRIYTNFLVEHRKWLLQLRKDLQTEVIPDETDNNKQTAAG